jgi:hypothetical protein
MELKSIAAINALLRAIGKPTPAANPTKKASGKLKKVSLVRPKKKLPKGARIIKIRATLPGQTPRTEPVK